MLWLVRKRKKNEIVLFLFFATSGASEHFQAPSCIYLESARRVLSDDHKLWPSGARERFSHVYVVVHHTDVNGFQPAYATGTTYAKVNNFRLHSFVSSFE